MQRNLLDNFYLGQSPHPDPYHLTSSHIHCAVPDNADSQLHMHPHMPVPRHCQSWPPVRVLCQEVALPAVVVMVLVYRLRVHGIHLQDRNCCPVSREDSMDWPVWIQDRGQMEETTVLASRCCLHHRRMDADSEKNAYIDLRTQRRDYS